MITYSVESLFCSVEFNTGIRQKQGALPIQEFVETYNVLHYVRINNNQKYERKKIIITEKEIKDSEKLYDFFLDYNNYEYINKLCYPFDILYLGEVVGNSLNVDERVLGYIRGKKKEHISFKFHGEVVDSLPAISIKELEGNIVVTWGYDNLNLIILGNDMVCYTEDGCSFSLSTLWWYFLKPFKTYMKLLKDCMLEKESLEYLRAKPLEYLRAKLLVVINDEQERELIEGSYLRFMKQDCPYKEILNQVNVYKSMLNLNHVIYKKYRDKYNKYKVLGKHLVFMEKVYSSKICCERYADTRLYIQIEYRCDDDELQQEIKLLKPMIQSNLAGEISIREGNIFNVEVPLWIPASINEEESNKLFSRISLDKAYF